jgi:hypothetical protein
MAEAKQLVAKIAGLLREAHIPFKQGPLLGGLTPDFAFRGPSGELVVVEAKTWDPKGGNTARALEQAGRYKKLTGADRILFVLEGLKKNFREEGVVNLAGLSELVQEYGKVRTKRKRARKPVPKAPKRIVFAAMPFEREYDDTYLVAMTYASMEAGAACKRVDRTEFTGDIVEEIKHLIRTSIAVIVDLSESKPNVLYEAGFAHAMNKPAVHICSSPLNDLPFDVRNWNTIEYRLGQTAILKKPLARRLKAVLA